MNQLVTSSSGTSLDIAQGEKTEDFVTFMIKEQLFGIPVLKVQDILAPDRIARIPLAPAEVAGSINLRGRIVTVIDVRTRLGLSKRAIPSLAAPQPDADESGVEAGAEIDEMDDKASSGIGGRLNKNELGMGVTVEHKSDLYTFLVDSVGEVLSMKASDYEKTPGTLDPLWREFSCGVYRLDGRLMVILDVEKMLALSSH